MKAILKKQRTEFGKRVRKEYERIDGYRRKEISQYVVRTDGISNTLTRIEKDNYVYETD